MAKERPRGATPGPRSGAADKRSYSRPEVNGGGGEELPHNRGEGRRLGVPGCNATRVAERSYPMSKERWLRGHRRAKRSYSTFKVRRGGGEEVPLVQSKEQRWLFAGAAVKR